MTCPTEIPNWVAALGFYVYEDHPGGAWIAAHTDPKYGDHGAAYAAYGTMQEAIHRVIREASR